MTTPIAFCRRCGRELTELTSILNGIGPECQEQETARLAQLARFTPGTRVLITGGEGSGMLGTVRTTIPLRRGKVSPRPVQVTYDRAGSCFYAYDQLSIIRDPLLTTGTDPVNLTGGAA